MERFRSDVRQFRSSTEQIRRTSNRLFTALESLNSTWSGSAHSIYIANVKEDEELMASVFKALRELGEELEEADAVYRKCEDQVEQEINSLVV